MDGMSTQDILNGQDLSTANVDDLLAAMKASEAAAEPAPAEPEAEAPKPKKSRKKAEPEPQPCDSLKLPVRIHRAFYGKERSH